MELMMNLTTTGTKADVVAGLPVLIAGIAK